MGEDELAAIYTRWRVADHRYWYDADDSPDRRHNAVVDEAAGDVQALVAEVKRLRAVEAAARVVAAASPRPKPYYGSAIWELDQALGIAEDAAEPGA